MIVAKAIFGFCQKLAASLMTAAEYIKTVNSFKNCLIFFNLTPGSEAGLVDRVVVIVPGCSYSRSSDCQYLALARNLSKTMVSSF